MQELIVKPETGIFFKPMIKLQSNGECWIAGQSYLEETVEFYEPILAWFDAYDKGVPLTLNIKLTYFNTSSYKEIVKVLKKVKDLEEEGCTVAVKWHYPEDDEDLLEEAEDFMANTGLRMECIPYELEE
jgi:hypothetical protein